ncbi:MAG: phospholipid carrier-dependent glycosyltransferase, partial [Okeania sp. SIO3B3]|nr:phospholipid carrier-dependent glycosyltransferase [Okeania sp. SIO3B3]
MNIHTPATSPNLARFFSKNSQKGVFFWILMFTAVFLWRLPNLNAFGLSNDEGAHLMWAQLAVDGYTLYQEIHAVQSPLFLEFVTLAFRLLGPSIAAGRITTLIGFIALAIILSVLAYRAGGWIAACSAVLLLGASPLMFSLSRLVMAEIPATAWAVLAVGLAYTAYESKRWHPGWFLAAGLALGLSFVTKALHPFAVVPMGWLLLMKAYQSQSGTFWRIFIINSMLVSVGTIVPMIAVPVIYGPEAVYDQLIAFRGDLRAAIPGSWDETVTHFTTFFDSHWGYGLLAGSGLLSLMFSRRELRLYPIVWSLWLGAGVLMLLWHAPLFRHHFVVLLPPLILLGALGLAAATDFWHRVITRDKVAPWQWGGGIVITLMIA